MGTNYYLTYPEERCAHCGSVNPTRPDLHIGKSSAGWHFGLRGYEAGRGESENDLRN